jgi:hypothetical protein
MTLSGNLSMTRRCFFASAGLAVAATGAVGAEEKAAAADDNLPKASLLGHSDVSLSL